MTVHSAQGITSKTGIVVDLQRGGFETYVAASRATHSKDVFLVTPVSKLQLNSPRLPFSLRTELKRLQELAACTEERHGLDSPTRFKRPRLSAEA
ncbi:hypothetical protein A4X13_0g7096 [Tilletia indica]|uniref:Uncharacterized protein n=1 Tax=Tilletia indica TaxID=43049 RepID=A0A8T8SLI1_9BASI|nr:hypothetical protein A4X13_0g7096 [Tilletia indica]